MWAWPVGRGVVSGPGTALKRDISSASHFRVLPPPPPPPPVTAPGRPRHVPPPPPAAAAPMSRKKSGFAITSVRGGSGTAPGDASGGATGSSSSSSGSPSGSRFRLVRLLSPGEVLRRGRWLCRDFYERDASPRGGGGGRVPVSLDAPRAIAAPHQPRSLGTFAQLVQQALPPKPPSPRPGGGAELSARLGLAGEESEDEGAGSGVTAIDNKIERAMDLVKSHLLLAVREEVEALREQIRELSERRAALEQENSLLRALATPQQLARLRPPQPPAPP